MSENSANQMTQQANPQTPEQIMSNQSQLAEQPLPILDAYAQSETEALTQQLKSASSWFYVVAGLSVVNSLIATFGGGIRFIFGLGITSVADEVVNALQLGATGKVIGLMFTVAIAGLFAIFGFLSAKRMHWVFLIGMGIYLLDGLLLLLFGDYLGAAFHAWVLFRLFQGMSASRKLSSMAAS